MEQNAFIHPNAKIGKGVKIGYHSYIGDKVIIGDDTEIGPNAVIMSHTKIGKKCKIFPGAVLGCVPQDLKYIGEESYVEIGDNTAIREFATIHRGTADRMITKVGSNCLIMAYVHLAHDCIVGDNCIIGNNTQIAGHVIVEDWAIIGGACAIHQHLCIGKHSFVGGITFLGKDIPPYIRVRGNPHNSYAGVNSVGLKRRNFSQQTINEILDAYRIIYNSGLNMSNAIEAIKKLPSSNGGVQKEIIDFVLRSERGIITRSKYLEEETENQE